MRLNSTSVCVRQRLNPRVRLASFEIAIFTIATFAFLVSGCGGGGEPEGSVDKGATQSQSTSSSNEQEPSKPQPLQWAVTLPHSHSQREFESPDLTLQSNGSSTAVQLKKRSNRLHLITKETFDGDFRVELRVDQLSFGDDDGKIKVGFRPVDGTLATVEHELLPTRFSAKDITVARIKGRVGILLDDTAIDRKGVRNSAAGHVFIELQGPTTLRVAINKLEGERTQDNRLMDQPGQPLQVSPKDWVLLDERTRKRPPDSSSLRVIKKDGTTSFSTTEPISQIICLNQKLEGDFYFAVRVFLKPGPSRVGICIVPTNETQSVSMYKRSAEQAGDVWFIEIVRRGDEIRLLRYGGRVKKLLYDGSGTPLYFGFTLEAGAEIQLDGFRLERLASEGRN